MTKKLIWIGVALAALVAFNSNIFARITGTTVNPETCWGDGGEEACVDSSGNFISTTDNDAALGTTALRWSEVQTMDAVLGDDLHVADVATVVGSMTVTGAQTLTGITTANSAIRLTALNGSTTAQTIVAATSQTADLLAISSVTATAATLRVTSGGQFLPLRLTVTQIDTLVPAGVGAVILCTNCTIPYSVCTATGTAAGQWARAGSATVGCGTNN